MRRRSGVKKSCVRLPPYLYSSCQWQATALYSNCRTLDPWWRVTGNGAQLKSASGSGVLICHEEKASGLSIPINIPIGLRDGTRRPRQKLVARKSYVDDSYPKRKTYHRTAIPPGYEIHWRGRAVRALALFLLLSLCNFRSVPSYFIESLDKAQTDGRPKRLDWATNQPLSCSASSEM